jgi:hypothetical protein
LRALKDEQQKLLTAVLGADEKKMFHVDLVVVGAVQRSLSLIDGFTSLVEARNALTAIPLVRLQIDSVIRIYACWLVKDPAEVAKALLDDKPLSKVQSADGKSLTDRTLYEAAAEHYAWMPVVYQQTSGFVHLSVRHISAPITKTSDSGELEMRIGPGRTWTEQDILEALEAFRQATLALIHLCWSWLQTKQCGTSDGKTAG